MSTFSFFITSYLRPSIPLMNQRSFGRKTEQLDEMHQMTLFEVFNEPEVLSDNSTEPGISETIISSHPRKKKTSREENLEGLPARIFEHTLSDEELKERFPDGYTELPMKFISVCLSFPRPLSWMNIMCMYMPLKAMTAP